MSEIGGNNDGKNSEEQAENSNVQAMLQAGLPDLLVARKSNISIQKVRNLRVALGLASMTAQQSRLAREEYVRSHPNKKVFEFSDPPLDLEETGE